MAFSFCSEVKKVFRCKSLCTLLVIGVIVAGLQMGEADNVNNGITSSLYGVADGQTRLAGEVTDFVVKGVEGKFVGERKSDGSNWSIVNIIEFNLRRCVEFCTGNG